MRVNAADPLLFFLKDSMENNEVGWVGKQGTVVYVGKEAYRVFCLSGRMLDSVF